MFQLQILIVPHQEMEGESLLGHRGVRWVLRDVEGPASRNRGAGA